MSATLRRSRTVIALTLLALPLLTAACGSATTTTTPATTAASGSITVNSSGGITAYLQRRERPIGRGIRFHPSLSGQPTGNCKRSFRPRFQAHIEVFGANKVVLLPGGIGTSPPRTLVEGQLTAARCFGNVVTLNPTGVLYVRPGAQVTLATLFSAWGEPLSAARVASFSGGKVRVFVNGKRLQINPADLRITPHAEIVIETGPYVPPHVTFAYSTIPKVS